MAAAAAAFGTMHACLNLGGRPAGLARPRIIIAPEVRGDNFGSLAFFLSIVAGDSVRIPVKYGQPMDVENFPVQGLMATNELPESYMNDPNLSARH